MFLPVLPNTFLCKARAPEGSSIFVHFSANNTRRKISGGFSFNGEYTPSCSIRVILYYSAILKKFEEEFPITDVPLKMKRKHGREGTRRKTAAKTEASGEEKENVLPSEASSSKVTLVQSDGMYVHLHNHCNPKPHESP